MDSRDRILTALAHRQPDAVPVDFGATAVTGIHVSAVAALRDYYGLEKRPVKVHEPYQMLGLLEDDLQRTMGIDVTGVVPRKTMFGFPNGDWKMWRMPDGLEVLVPGGFVTTSAPNGDILIHPEGDAGAPPSGRMPADGYFFDAIVRQPPIDDATLDVEDNLEEFGPIADEDLQHIRREVAAAAATGRGVIANFGGTAFGDIALVPAPFLKHPKGIRDVAEWYMSTATPPRLHPPHLLRAVRFRHCQPGEDSWRGGRCGGRGLPVRHRFRHPDVFFLLRQDAPGALLPLLPAHERLDSLPTPRGAPSSTPAERWRSSSPRFSKRASTC